MIKSSFEFINILGIAIGIGISELSGVARNIKGSPLIDTIEASNQHHIIISVLQGNVIKMLTGNGIIMLRKFSKNPKIYLKRIFF